ncbi:MAG TPA: RNA polymerase sigma-54 factor, partial [Thermoanaerobaculia bacterium]|nr:RNA polymerase sigma-54 factor [Thermoanaerobaculia bacterium]
MTPSLQQAIKLLQMTRMELDHLLTQELVENPILEDQREIAEGDEGDGPEGQDAQEAEAEKNGDEIDHEESIENIDLDAYFGDYFESSGYASMSEQRDEAPIENSLTRPPDLYDHLLWQLHMADVPLETR